MTTLQEKYDGATAGLQSHYTLQKDATDTVAGGEAVINHYGEYVFFVDGTLNTAEVDLYVKRAGTTSFNIAQDSAGSPVQLTADGDQAIVSLSKGDVVYSKTDTAGASTSYTAILNPTEA